MGTKGQRSDVCAQLFFSSILLAVVNRAGGSDHRDPNAIAAQRAMGLFFVLFCFVLFFQAHVNNSCNLSKKKRRREKNRSDKVFCIFALMRENRWTSLTT